jgi:hypothetical protein
VEQLPPPTTATNICDIYWSDPALGPGAFNGPNYIIPIEDLTTHATRRPCLATVLTLIVRLTTIKPL